MASLRLSTCIIRLLSSSLGPTDLSSISGHFLLNVASSYQVVVGIYMALCDCEILRLVAALYCKRTCL